MNNTKTTNDKNNSLKWLKEVHSEAATMARWMAMYEAVNIVADKAEEKGIISDDVVYKPKAIQDYIDSTQDIILRKILEQEYNIRINYVEESPKTDFIMV